MINISTEKNIQITIIFYFYCGYSMLTYGLTNYISHYILYICFHLTVVANDFFTLYRKNNFEINDDRTEKHRSIS